MSKVDALRALREARYAAASASGTKIAGKPVAVVPDSAQSTAPAQKSVPARRSSPKAKNDAPALYVVPDAEPATADASTDNDAPVEVAAELCGHRSMGGKSCSRPAGHSEKNHRYK